MLLTVHLCPVVIFILNDNNISLMCQIAILCHCPGFITFYKNRSKGTYCIWVYKILRPIWTFIVQTFAGEIYEKSPFSNFPNKDWKSILWSNKTLSLIFIQLNGIKCSEILIWGHKRESYFSNVIYCECFLAFLTKKTGITKRYGFLSKNCLTILSINLKKIFSYC